MPRKVQPRWDALGVEKVPDFKLSADQLAALAGILEIDRPPTIAKLKSELESIGAYYPVWLQQDEKGPSWNQRGLIHMRSVAYLHSRFSEFLTEHRCQLVKDGRPLDS
jgi:hypothetical protein